MPKITGKARVAARIRAIASEEVVRAVGAALFVGGELVRAEASHMITEGAVSGKNHVPSLPGNPPLEDTGTLRTHIETTQVAPLKVEVSSNAPYSAALEFGTSKMAERPFMSPALQRKRKEVAEGIRRAVNEAIKRA
jgi:HK97 gp10 family phage protein